MRKIKNMSSISGGLENSTKIISSGFGWLTGVKGGSDHTDTNIFSMDNDMTYYFCTDCSDRPLCFQQFEDGRIVEYVSADTTLISLGIAKGLLLGVAGAAVGAVVVLCYR